MFGVQVSFFFFMSFSLFLFNNSVLGRCCVRRGVEAFQEREIIEIRSR
jgi:hypothetical protein